MLGEKMRLLVFSAAMAMICLSGGQSSAQDKPAAAQDKPKDDVNPDDIIRKFAAKEAEFKEARGNYTYRQTVKMEELDPPPTGRWEEVDDIIFNGQGKRIRVCTRCLRTGKVVKA